MVLSFEFWFGKGVPFVPVVQTANLVSEASDTRVVSSIAACFLTVRAHVAPVIERCLVCAPCCMSLTFQ